MKKTLVTAIIISSITFFMFEIGLATLTNFSIIKIGVPSYTFSNITSRFWVDANEDFGVWHEPNSKYTHAMVCFEVDYLANQHGARDKERTLNSTQNRTVVLGDSFTEGFGIETGYRFTDIFENQTGREHLNFGTTGSFGTIQQSLMYETMASKFTHDSVIIAMLPENDFFDDDLDYGKEYYSDRYRPYYNGEYPDYNIVYHPQNFVQHQSPSFIQKVKGFFREYTHTIHLLIYLKGLYFHNKNVGAIKNTYSGYYDFDKESINRMRFSYEKIIRIAKQNNRDVFIFSIPMLTDIQRFKNEGKAPLTEIMQDLSNELGFEYIDLLPHMASYTPNWDEYYLTCNDHWSNKGHSVAADYLINQFSLYK